MDHARGIRLVRGEARFTDDHHVPGAAWAAFVRSPHAHARVRRIEADHVRALPGVAAVVTAADIAGGLSPLRCYCSVTGSDGRPNRPADWAVLASGRVRHVGDPVACVVAESRDGAEAAAQAVSVAYEPLPAFIDPFGPVAEPIWPDAPDNLCFDCAAGDADATDRLFRSAARVVRLRLRYPRIVVAPMETRAAIGSYDVALDRFHLRTTCQGVHWVRRVLADALAVAPERLRVETGALGGGFGCRIFAYPEYALVLWLARRVGRPVRWASSRSEAFRTDTQGRDHSYEAALALADDGRFLALRVEDRTCLGAYLSQYTPYAQAGCGAPVQAGGYRIEALHVRTRGYFTNMAPVDAYRGTGRPEATYVLERLIDQAAFELRLDPVALRAWNLRACTAEPATLVTGQTIDGGRFRDNQDLCVARADRAGFAARRTCSERRGRLRGFGLANYLEANGSFGVARLTTGGMPVEAASIAFDRGGRIAIRVGTQSSGQDHATPLVRVVAGRLGVDPRRIAVEEGDSDALPLGGGTGGSRSTLAGLNAIEAVLAEVERRARALCADRWGVTGDAVALDAGTFRDRTGDRSATFDALRESMPGAFDATATVRFESGSFANGCHACEIEIDPWTGAIKVLAYTAVDDFGTVLDAYDVRGQVRGGVVQGLGTALMEECAYDPASGRLSTACYETYPVPRSGDAPTVEWLDNGLPSSRTPLGVKACGEAAISVAPAAVMNAVVDALRDFASAETLQMPATAPAILRIIANGRTP